MREVFQSTQACAVSADYEAQRDVERRQPVTLAPRPLELELGNIIWIWIRTPSSRPVSRKLELVLSTSSREAAQRSAVAETFRDWEVDSYSLAAG